MPEIYGQTTTLFGLPISADLLFAFILVVLVLGIRMFKSLLNHQQKMTELMRPTPGMLQSAQDVEAMRRDMELMKSAMDRQSAILDNIALQQRQLAQTLSASSETNSSIQGRLQEAPSVSEQRQ